LVRAGLAKRPEKRPATARAFLTALEAAAVDGYGAGWEERGRRELRRLALLLAALFPAPAVAGGGLGAFALTILRRVAIGGAAGAAAIFAIAHAAAPSDSATPASAPIVSMTDTLGPLTSRSAPAPPTSAPTRHRHARSTATTSTPGAPATSRRVAPPPPGSSHALPPPVSTSAAPHTTPPAPPPPPAVHLGKITLVVNGMNTTADAVLSVFADNTQPFTVRLKYSDGVVDSFTESGATSYTVTDAHTFTSCPNPPGTWTVTAVSSPAADNSSITANPVAC
jgi:serine/threonine-protein kinase